MSDFKTAYSDTANLDPYKRVNYENGLVLGVDEFRQEELYHFEKRRLHNRSLHGYGTVCGLRIYANGPRIKVEPGIAVNPKGQEIRVPQAQCAQLNDWLARNREKVEGFLSSPPQNLPLYLVLCFRECPTDKALLLSGSCMSTEDNSAPSRIADDFELSLWLEPPDQTEDEKALELIDLLSQIEISDDPGEFLTQAQLEELVRDLARTTSPPLASPSVSSPPAPMRMLPGDAKDFINAAFRIWVTEVRPKLLEAGRNCVAGPPIENCVLLAQIEFDIEKVGNILRVSGDVTINEKKRPYLLHTRLLQEYLNSCFIRSSGSEIITNPRIDKHIILGPQLGQKVKGGAKIVSFNGVPALRFRANGDATFNLPVPDDIDFDEPVRVRLVWSFFIKPLTAGNIHFTWQVLNKYVAPDEELPKDIAAFSSVGDIKGRVPRVRRNRVLTTLYDASPPSDYFVLKDQPARGDVFGALRLHLTATTPTYSIANEFYIYLLHVEVAYTANRLGRQLP